MDRKEHDLLRPIREMRRLQIDDGDTAEILDCLLRHLFNLDFEQLHHRDVFRTCNTAERPERSALFVAPEDLAEREPARNRVGIGIILEQDQDVFRVFKVSLDLFNLPHRLGEPDVPAEIRLQQLGKRHEMSEGSVFFGKIFRM